MVCIVYMDVWCARASRNWQEGDRRGVRVSGPGPLESFDGVGRRVSVCGRRGSARVPSVTELKLQGGVARINCRGRAQCALFYW